MALVVIGGGVIGLSIAYFSSLHDPCREIIIVDSEEQLLLSASGFSGGYIVRDWFSPSVIPLAELSYTLHRELAEKNDGKHQWGYTESISYSASVEQRDSTGRATGKKVRGEDWLLTGNSRAEVARLHARVSQPDSLVQSDPLLRPDGSPIWANVPADWKLERISSPEGCAQVEPRELCEWLIKQCTLRGVKILLGTKVTGFLTGQNGSTVGLRATRKPSQSNKVEVLTLKCKDIVLAAGCWTPQVYGTLLGKEMSPTIKPLPGYSLVVRSPRYSRSILHADHQGKQTDMSHAVFFPPGQSWSYSPECMARLTRSGKPEIYVAGLNDETLALPEMAGQTKELIKRAAIDDLKRTAISLTGNTQTGSNIEDDLEIVREGLCYRPVSTSGVPIIGKVPNVHVNGTGGVYVAAGHGPWGVTLCFGTGLVVSELLQGRRPSADLSHFGVQVPLQARL